MPSRKIPPDEFAEKFVEMKARGLNQQEIAEELGISAKTVRRYKKDEDVVQSISEIRNTPSQSDEDVADKITSPIDDEELEDVSEAIEERSKELKKEGIEKGKKRAERCLDTAFKLSMKTSQALLKEYRNYRNSGDFKERKYALNQLKSAASQARSTLSVAKLELEKEKAVNELQVNIDNREGISEALFFGALRYGLEPIEDEAIISEVLERIEDYLRERNALKIESREVDN